MSHKNLRSFLLNCHEHISTLSKRNGFGASGPCNHLHVICNNPVYYPVNDCYCILVVNVSSIKPGVPHDGACVLQPGDHRFIQHPSYIVYAEAVIWRIDNLEENTLLAKLRLMTIWLKLFLTESCLVLTFRNKQNRR